MQSYLGYYINFNQITVDVRSKSFLFVNRLNVELFVTLNFSEKLTKKFLVQVKPVRVKESGLS
jgi:hypothetical protein